MKKMIGRTLVIISILIFVIAIAFAFAPTVIDTVMAFLFGAVSILTFWLSICILCKEEE